MVLAKCLNPSMNTCQVLSFLIDRPIYIPIKSQTETRIASNAPFFAMYAICPLEFAGAVRCRGSGGEF